MCGFESILKRGLCLGNLYNDSGLNVYTGVCLLKNVSMFESCLEIVYVFLKITRMVCNFIK